MGLKLLMIVPLHIKHVLKIFYVQIKTTGSRPARHMIGQSAYIGACSLRAPEVHPNEFLDPCSLKEIFISSKINKVNCKCRRKEFPQEGRA